MEAQTLVRLGQRSETESDDLGALVRQLVDAAEPLTGTFNGPAKARFNNFKVRTDDIATALNNALVGIVGSISGQNRAFVTAAEDGASAHENAEGSSDFSAQSLLARISPQA
ncbi:hypothetical protein N8K70_15115 [Microbacterium betulae]|uniref:Uncharacterized protein n=1 Tax=Microbacterium betulae TaxID=2981139 RepID=A0AA97FGS0_9MICO|nr:hypothetical protein [Microbacterium sp. AB]WOF22705.1 hypothetical protein N8K70_15115 [Microbacterium sp. AB]